MGKNLILSGAFALGICADEDGWGLRRDFMRIEMQDGSCVMYEGGGWE